jgi:hypothetical protein
MNRLFFIFFLLLNLPFYSKAQNVKQTIINGKRYSGQLDQWGFYVIKSKHDTILSLPQVDYMDFKFYDFNSDGYKDIYLEWGGNIPDRYTLYAYNPSSGKFKEIKNFSDFPLPLKIQGTNYYYSYARGGCADEAWNSYLFYIKNYVVIKLGLIHGDGCGITDGIYIYKDKSGKENLIKTLPLNTIEKYKDYKWGFIKEYWSKNYKKFL